MSTSAYAPQVHRITRRDGVAGQVSYTARVTYGDDPFEITFVGSVYGGPVLMVDNTWETWVDEPARFGDLSAAWVRRFFA
ncbi:hypothetical protein [Mycobacterium sp.]|uniref:hypothetical protein n=1 Tax=Mycobacterium sp. TaxID=1785 RepID=UPI003F945BFE